MAALYHTRILPLPDPAKMPRKGQTKRKASIGDVRDSDSLEAHMLRFSQWAREKAYSERTIENREAALRPFIAWCAERGLTSPREITKPILERYQRHLFLYRKADGAGAPSARPPLPAAAPGSWNTSIAPVVASYIPPPLTSDGARATIRTEHIPRCPNIAYKVTTRLLPQLMVLDSVDDVWVVDDGMKEAFPVFG